MSSEGGLQIFLFDRLLEELEDAQAAREALAEYEQGETISLEQMIEKLTEAPGAPSD